MSQELCVISVSVHYRFTLQCVFDSQKTLLLSEHKKILMLSLFQEEWYHSIAVFNPSQF